MAKVGKQMGGGRNRARAGTGRGQVGQDRACGQAGRRGRRRRHLLTGKVKRDAAPGCELPDGAPQNKNLNFIYLFYPVTVVN